MAKKNKKQGARRRGALIVVAVVVIALALLAGMFYSTADSAATIYVRRGSTSEQLADSLSLHLGKDFSGKVMKMLTLSGANISERHGAFKVRKGESTFSVARHLRGGAPNSITLTFNNIRTKRELADRIGGLYMMGRDSIWQALNDPKLCAKYGFTPDNVVCMMIPDSYDFYWDISTKEFFEKMHQYYDDYWTKARRSKAEQLGLTPEQVVTVASIAEEESAQPDERGKIGRLYINRFKKGMRLQADPTVKFAIGDFSIRRITVAMTQKQSPYNTYRNPGLPPGPIRLPEKATVDAILNSKPHNYIYMCAKEDFSGYHNFASTYEEHMAYAKKYQAALNARGIK